MKLHKCILSGFMAIVIAISLSAPAYAIGPGTIIEGMQVVPDFGSWLWSTAKTGGNLFAGFLDGDNYCVGAETSLNGRHDYAPQHTTVNGKTGYFYICQNCGKSAGEVLEPAYDSYVSSLPASGYNSSGNLIWRSTISDIVGAVTRTSSGGYTVLDSKYYTKASNGLNIKFEGNGTGYFDISLAVRCPFSGNYRLLPEIALSFGSDIYYRADSWIYRSQGDIFYADISRFEASTSSPPS